MKKESKSKAVVLIVIGIVIAVKPISVLFFMALFVLVIGYNILDQIFATSRTDEVEVVAKIHTPPNLANCNILEVKNKNNFLFRVQVNSWQAEKIKVGDSIMCTYPVGGLSKTPNGGFVTQGVV